MNLPSARPNQHRVRVWRTLGLELEDHQQAPGRAGKTPRHVHDTYQICVSLNFPGNYHYRRANHSVPVGAISVIHPGELHAAYDPHDREQYAHYRLFYVAPAILRSWIGYDMDTARPDPFFAQPIITDQVLTHRLVQSHEASSRGEGEDALLATLSQLIHRYSDQSVQALMPDPRITAARLFINQHYAEPLCLNDIAEAACLSPFHFQRVFTQHTGLSPAHYHRQVRLQHARRQLLAGHALKTIARNVGFTDQSHLTKWFKKYYLVTPAQLEVLTR